MLEICKIFSEKTQIYMYILNCKNKILWISRKKCIFKTVMAFSLKDCKWLLINLIFNCCQMETKHAVGFGCYYFNFFHKYFQIHRKSLHISSLFSIQFMFRGQYYTQVYKCVHFRQRSHSKVLNVYWILILGIFTKYFNIYCQYYLP